MRPARPSSVQAAGARWWSAARLAFWLLLAAIVVLSLSPAAYLPPQAFSLWDKAQHALGFAALGLLGGLAYPARIRLLSVCLLAFGGAIELAQAATGWRHGDWADLLADGIGLVVGLLLARLLVPRCSSR